MAKALTQTAFMLHLDSVDVPFQLKIKLKTVNKTLNQGYGQM